MRRNRQNVFFIRQTQPLDGQEKALEHFDHPLGTTRLGYLKDSNAAAHSVDTDISQAVRRKRIENDIECPIYMLESTRIITISQYKELVGTLFRK